jgi:hypothetical protein
MRVKRMSEYQYVDFQAIDAPVSEKNLGFLRRQSTRAEITLDGRPSRVALRALRLSRKQFGDVPLNLFGHVILNRAGDARAQEVEQ